MVDLLVSLLVAVLPACPTEDSSWCVWQGETVTVVNLAPADPAPASLVVGKPVQR